MQTINIFNVMGNIGSDVQVTKVGNDISRASVQIATNIGMGDKQRTQWHTAVFWGEYADAVANLKKGDSLYVSGLLEYRRWKDAQTGADREKTEINVTQFSRVENPALTVNQVNILGHIGTDAQFKVFQETCRTTLSVATNSGYGDKQRVQWHNIVFWGKSAEVVSKLKKGDVIFVNGLVDYRKWQTESGENRERTEIQAQQFSIVKGEIGKVQSAQNPAPQQKEQQPTGYGNLSKGSEQPTGYGQMPNEAPNHKDELIDLPY
ncbi:single-stranded DNA-binding protein [Acinetobacter sp. ANC 5380]|uniref:Single-stranded DNA-binding protein n=1 Tax=Acinetobacter terrae TaxID=2731247 RepID=A0A7Y2RI35_9GAMM|nr:single-stranded DNA-binding protein [Acinetobacter terrae]NNH79034.1 single-stranded DNA-binding protein [Acinetobacter terrae]